VNTQFDPDLFLQEMDADITVAINKAIVSRVAEQPLVPLLNLEDITVESIKAFLGTKHTSTWSVFSIGSEDSMEKAAEWFKRELDLLYAFTYRSEEYEAIFNHKTTLRR
jgi:hypothetical protein